MIEPWNPWRALVEDFPHVRVSFDYELPERTLGMSTRDGRIWVCKTLTGYRRTSTLAHELIHQERGIFPCDEAEEEIVREITTRRLIPLPNLIEVATQHPAASMRVWADALWVCVPDVRDRMRFLTSDERDQMPATYVGTAKPPAARLTLVN